MGRNKKSHKWIIVFLVFLLVGNVGLSIPVYAFESNVKNEKANTFLKAKNYGKAVLLYEDTLKEEPEDFEAGFGRAMCLVKLNRYYLALEQLSVMKGSDEEELLKISDSIRQIKMTLLDSPNEEILSYYRDLIENEDSFQAMDIILRNYPDYPTTDYYRAMLYTEVFTYPFCKEMNGSSLQELGDFYRDIVTEFPWQESFQNAYRENLAIRIDKDLTENKLIDVKALITTALASDPDNLKFLLSQGELYYETGEYESSRRLMEEVIHKDPTLKSAYSYLMRCEYREKEYLETIETANQLLALDNQNIYGFTYLYLANLKLNRREESRIWLEAIRNYEGDFYDKACALSLVGKRKLALQYLTHAIEMDPKVMYYAKYDEDLNSLHYFAEFRKLVQEEYIEELSDFYATIILGIGLLCFAIILLFDYCDKRKPSRNTVKMLLFCVLLCLSLLYPKEVMAKDHKLREKETERFFGQSMEDQDKTISANHSETKNYIGNDTADLCCDNELEWMLQNIEINEHTITPMDEGDIEEASVINQCATVNVQSVSGGGQIYGQGSGIIVGYDEDKITIIGCRHTLYTDNIRVRFGNGDSARAEVVGKSENNDFMVLHVPIDKLFIETKDYVKKVSIDYSVNENLKINDEVVTNGFITTKGYITFPGSILNLSRSYHNFQPYYTNHVPYLLTSTKAVAGTSGGGTFDEYGNFIGLQAGIVVPTGERYVVPFSTIVEEYFEITGESLE